jgi:hypothetical protein
MLTDSACPDGVVPRDLLLGRVSDADAERLEAHLAQCPRCLETVRTLRINDTLLDALRSATDIAPAVPAGTGEELIGRLCALHGQPTIAQAPSGEPEHYEFLAPAEGPDELGRLGPYRIRRVLGSGGMGIVFQAEDPQLDRAVALKVMKPALAAIADARERFLREARAMAAVKSDHVVTIYQVGEDRGVPYLAMELLQGESMDRWLARGHRPGVPEVLRLGREMAQGLAAAHQRGLIHRDIKPGNIWLEAPTGRVKLLDFGLPRASQEDIHLTVSGAVIGTPGYMAPEQARSEALDHRADLFSLGVVLYRLCTGQMPFPGDTTMAVLTALAVKNPKPVQELVPDVPGPLAALVMQLLQKDPADRPQAAQDVAVAIGAMEHAASSPPPEPLPDDRGLRRRNNRWRIAVAVAVLLAVLGPLAWYFGSTVIRIATNKGELVVEVEDKDVEILVKPDGVHLRSGKEQTLVITAGDGVVEIRDPVNHWTLLTEEFRLKRGGREVVRVKQQTVALARAARAKNIQAQVVALDKDMPFVVVRRGGERRGFKAFADALAERKEGDAIEVYVNGPFPLPAIEVDGKGLVLKAAPGYRPVFAARVDEGARRPWLAVLGGEVVVEGCDFHGDTVFPGWFLDSGPEPSPAEPWTFRNCRFWVNGVRGLMACAAPRLRLEDCMIVAAPRETLVSLALGADLEMTNNVVSVIGRHAIAASGKQTLRLTNNTFDAGPMTFLRPPPDKAPARPVAVVAEGNLFWNCPQLGVGGVMPSEEVARTQVSWRGQDNLYVRGSPYVSFAQGKRALKSLDEWNRLWGQAEPGSTEVNWIALHYDRVSVGDPAEVLRTARQEVEMLGRRLGAGARHIGPEWPLVGPGQAYIKVRERASGKLITKEHLRPQAPAGGPFVVLRNQEAPRGHATLQAALDASQDGDVIEVRTDGPFPGAVLKAPERGGRLTIRAAPGYRPAPQTRLHLELPKADVEFEGLAFTEAGQVTGDYGRLTLRNCDQWAWKEDVWNVRCVLHSPGQAARFINSLFHAGPACSVGPGQGVLVENCLLSRTCIDARADDDCALVIRRCVCWGHGLGEGAVYCVENPKAQVRVRAEDSVFLGGGVLAWSARQARWSGKNNLYSLSNAFAVFQPFYTLASWQKCWNSDRDSVFTPSPFLEPRMFRFLSARPKRPDGRDYGADVDKVARTAGP